MPKLPEIPKGMRPEEFLRDADLPAYYEQAAEEAKTDKDKAEYRDAAARARRAAAMTAAAVEETGADE